MRNLIEIDPKWLLEIAPHYYKESDFEDQSLKKKLKVAPTLKTKETMYV